MSLTAEDGQAYAQRQFQRQSREGEETPIPRGPVPADAPTSAKLNDLTVRLDAALAAAGANPLPPDDLAIMNAAVVELQAYEALLAAPAPVTAPPVNVDVPYASQTNDTLDCTMGNWENEPTSYSYQWQFDGMDVGIAGPDSNTYVLTDNTNTGKSATCIVTASNDLGATVAPPSNAVVLTDPTTQAAREA